MAHQLYLNHLAAISAFHNLKDFEAALKEFISCISYIAPACRARAFEVLYDEIFEQNVCITDGTIFTAAINKIQDRDLTKLWYLYTRNLASLSSDDKISVQITRLSGKGAAITADVSSEIVVFFPKWLSFKGSVLFDQHRLKVRENAMNGEYEVYNTIKLLDFVMMWPKFEPSPKHRKTGYILNNDYISPMPLSDDDAQAALLLSIDHNGERFVRFENAIYRFLKTHIDQTIYHGFMIEEADCPIPV